jgi:vacuolar-type H+-ATPase subunit H
VVKDVNSLNKLADMIKMPELKTLSLSPVDLSFEIIGGKVFVKPFDIKYEDIKANIGGWTALDQTIDYIMKLTVPRAKFGGAANSVLENLVSEANKQGTNFSLGENVDLTVLIGGTLTDPKLKTSLGKGSGSMMDDLKKMAQEEFEKQKQKLEEEARKELENQKQNASREADRIIADAEQQAQKILREAQVQADAINKTAAESAQQVKTEAEKQAKSLIDEGKKNGVLGEMAAKKGAEAVKKEANKNADKMVVEAKKKSDDIMQAARNQVEKIRLDAKAKADKSIKDVNLK